METLCLVFIWSWVLVVCAGIAGLIEEVVK